MRPVRSIIYLFLVGLFLFSCKSETKKVPEPKQKSVKELVKYKYKLTPFAPSKEYADAAIKSMTYKNGKFNFDISGKDYKLGAQTPDAPQKMCANSGKGQHIHLIIDNAPYAAKYTADFDYQIPDGEHTLLAFLSRSYHESIKTPQAHVAKKINVKNNTITESKPITAPMVFYSRPKGVYVGKDTKKVMLDFYLANADLGKGYDLIANINGEDRKIDRWQPYYIEGLPMGENTITLTLKSKDGKTINSVTRKFKLMENPDPK